MPQVVREDYDDLNAVLKVQLKREDYEEKFKSELNKYRKQAQMKGFRKGKTPISVIRKMYGKSVLANIINEQLQQQLFEYLSQEDINILGQPLPTPDQESIDFDTKNLEDYEFRFEIGMAPEFELQGIGKEKTFTKDQIQISEETIDRQIERIQRQNGETTHPEEDIREGDLLKLSVRELQDGAPKEEGLTSEFSVALDTMTETYQQEFLKKKKGDTLTIDIFELEENTETDYVRNYFLNLEEDDDRKVGNQFEATIQEVNRIQPAELNQELFDQVYEEGEISSTGELRERICKDIAQQYQQQIEALLFRDIQEYLMEENNIDLPHDFLKRWLQASNEDHSAEDIEAQYDNFAQNVRWSLIKGKLVKKYGLEADETDIKAMLAERVRGYFSGSSFGADDFIQSMVERLMQDEKQVDQAREEILSDQLLDVLMSEFTIEEIPIEEEAFNQKLQKIQEETAAERNPQIPAAEEEE